MTYQRKIDVSGLHCPLPVLKSRAALLQMAHGETLCVVTTDHCAREEIDSLARRFGHEVLDVWTGRNESHIFVRANRAPASREAREDWFLRIVQRFARRDPVRPARRDYGCLLA